MAPVEVMVAKDAANNKWMALARVSWNEGQLELRSEFYRSKSSALSGIIRVLDGINRAYVIRKIG